LKRFSLDLVLRYNDALADLLCEYPDDLIGVVGYDMFVGYQPPNHPNRTNTIKVMMESAEWTDEWGTRWAHAFGGVGATPVAHPLTDWSQLNEYLTCRVPNPHQPGRLDAAAQVVKKHGQTKYCMGMIHNMLFERLHALRGMENMLMDFYTNEHEVNRLAEALTAFAVEMVRNWAGIGVDAILVTDDWGTQNAMMISLPMWRKYFKGHYRMLFDEAHRCGLDIFFHSCGNVIDIVPDLIDLGLDVIDPLQPGAMDLEETARRFGGRIAFQGAIDEQHLLTEGSPRQIKDEVRRTIDLLGRPFGNAFIVAPANMLTPDIPFENLVALFEACHEQ
jgi:uroporphyrinogen decarboxylase